MHYMTTWTFRPEHTKEAIDRFMETGGLPPEGVTMVSRWHDVGGTRGFAITETDDPVALGKWCNQWNDLISFEIIPILDDEQIKAVLES